MTSMPSPPRFARITVSACADYQLVDSQGATEGTIRNETAEAVADITSTGETLRANGLKILGDGMIHASQATLFRARRRDWTQSQRDTLKALEAKLTS
jgi:ATP phosphoribosyltransferase